MIQLLKNSFVGTASIFSIEILDYQVIPEILKFGGQTVIGCLTIVYLVLKIKELKNDKKRNEKLDS